MNFCELFTEFCQIKGITAKQSTLSTYQKLYEAQLKAYFQDTDVIEFNNSLISNFILTLSNKGISTTYLNGIKGLLYSVLNYARTTYPQYSNLRYIEKFVIPIHRKKIKIFYKDEQQKIEGCILKHKTPFNISVLLSLYTGIRVGELCALRIGNFNLENKTVFIGKTMQRVKDISPTAKKKTKITIENPKSEKSIRILPLPDFIIPILQELFMNADTNSFILTLSQSKFIEPRLYEEKFKKLLVIAGIEKQSPRDKVPHTIRHTFANNMLDLGIDIKTLSELLGHSSVTITMEHYIHTNMERTLKYISLLNNQFLSHQNVY